MSPWNAPSEITTVVNAPAHDVNYNGDLEAYDNFNNDGNVIRRFLEDFGAIQRGYVSITVVGIYGSVCRRLSC